MNSLLALAKKKQSESVLQKSEKSAKKASPDKVPCYSTRNRACKENIAAASNVYDFEDESDNEPTVRPGPSTRGIFYSFFLSCYFSIRALISFFKLLKFFFRVKKKIAIL